MPLNYKKEGEWNGDRFRKWANKIGPSTYKVIDQLLNHYKAEQQAYNGCRSILKLADSYSSKQLEEACHMALLIDAETDSKHNHKIERLATNEYINKYENLIIVGATGSGKSYIACALGVEACNATMKVMYVRLPDLLAELDLAKVQGNYRKRINQYIKCDLLILDEWLLIGTNNAEQQDILEILEKRYRIHSTVFCSQFDVAGWYSKLGGGALADAIMDRIISKSQTIKIFGDKSMRSR